jgi:hypothetical protein
VHPDLWSPLPLKSCGRSENTQRQNLILFLGLGGEQRVCSGRCFISGRFFDSVPHVIPAQCSVVFSLTLSPTARILFLLQFPTVAPVSIFQAHKQV